MKFTPKLLWGPLSLATFLYVGGSGSVGAGLPMAPQGSEPRDGEWSPEIYREQIEADWLRQAEAIQEGGKGVTVETDARGACDGVRDGKYGFHTGQEPNPWWQVDVGEAREIRRLIVFNRLDYAPGLHNADRLRVLTSDDGEHWVLRHENEGHFGGVTGAPPLRVEFEAGKVAGRYVRLQVVSAAPIFFHLDEVEVYGAGEENLALQRRARQSSLSPWSTYKGFPVLSRHYPTREWLARGRRLATDLAAAGVKTAEALGRLGTLEGRLELLAEGSPEEGRRELYVATRWEVRALAFKNPRLSFDRLLFVKRFTQESYPDVCLNHMPWVSRPGGDLCVLSAPEGRSLAEAMGDPAGPSLLVREILNGALGPGHVHGMDLSWDGTRVVFGYARSETAEPPEGWLDRTRSYELRRSVEPTHIFEIGVDGGGLRQLTSGEWSDLDPTYAPNGDIVFVSERCGTSLQCNEYDKDETSCNLYVMKADGSGIRRLSVNKDGDYLPHTLDDGSIGYVRWEYHERSWAYIQSIWTVRPDGTGADAIFKQHMVNPWALEDTRSIPGSSKLVSVAAGHHTLAVGPIVVIDPAEGINEPRGIRIVTPQVKPTEGGMDGRPAEEGGTQDGGGLYSTPWALSERYFLAAYTYSNKETDAKGYALYLVDVFGNKELVYRDADISCFAPVPLRARPRPPVLPDLVDLTKDRAACVVSDVGYGSEDVASRVKYIRIAEPVGWPYENTLGGQRYGEKGPHLINWTPVRVLGDVPVREDGSAHFEVPADTAVYFQLLDENRMELRRMRSFISFQPGEQRACVGCHETRGLTALAMRDAVAAAEGPSTPLPSPWGDRPVSFLRDIQPILDVHCTGCHSGMRPAGQLDFTAGLTDWSREFEAWWGKVPGYGFNRAFETIARAGLAMVAEPNLQDASVTPPLAYGAHRSKLWQTLEKEPHRGRVRLHPDERLALSTWLDANAPYHDRFVNKRSGRTAYDLATDQELACQMALVHGRRCAPCHTSPEVSRLDWVDVRRPERSLFLSAPLRKSAGGAQTCPGLVYADCTDPDYKAVAELVTAAVRRAWEAPRRDVESLREGLWGR